MEILKQITDILIEHGAYVAVVLGVLVEIASRVLKTSKPMSILRLIAGGARKLISILDAVADILDKVIADRTK